MIGENGKVQRLPFSCRKGKTAGFALMLNAKAAGSALREAAVFIDCIEYDDNQSLPSMNHLNGDFMSYSTGIRVDRSEGERFRRAMVELRLFDRKLKVKSNDRSIFIPCRDLTADEVAALGEIGSFETVQTDFTLEERWLSVEDILGKKACYEIVGDIAIVEDDLPEPAARAILQVHKGVRVAVAPVSDVEGEFRVRRFRHLAGEDRTTTVHRENGLSFHLSLERAYFSPRLATERLRIANQMIPGQTVLDMFAGVGPYAILLAKRGAKVIAVDKNPAAIDLMLQNIAQNRVVIQAVLGDGAKVALQHQRSMDHIIMNLPHSASEFLEPAIKAAKDGGVVHYYSFAEEEELFKDSDLIMQSAEAAGRKAEIIFKGVVRSYSPRRYNVVIDFKL
jgi:tRNA (guanine37-N1)-methyltransferase